MQTLRCSFVNHETPLPCCLAQPEISKPLPGEFLPLRKTLATRFQISRRCCCPDPFSPFMSPGRACQVRGVLVPPSLRPPNWVCLAMIVRVQVATVCGYVFSPSWCLDRQHQGRPLPSVPPDPRSRKCWPSWSGFPGGSEVRNLLAMQESRV